MALSSVFYAPGQTAQAALIFGSSLSLSEAYNDNLFFTEQNRKSDFMTALSPAMSLAYTSRNVGLSVAYQGTAQFHSQNPEADGYFQSLSFNIDLPFLNRQIKGVEVRIEEQASYSPELPAFSFRGETEAERDARFDRVLQQGEGIQRSGRVNTFRNLAGLTLSYDWTPRFDTSVTYRNIIIRYSGDDFEDSETNNASFNARYHDRFSSRTSWNARYGLSAGLDGESDLLHSLNLGIEHQITHLLSASGSIGTSFVSGESPDLNLGAGLSKRYRGGSINLRYSRTAVRGLGVIRGVARRESLLLSAGRTLLERLSGSLQAVYVRNKSLDSNGVNAETYSASAGLSMRLLAWLNGSLSYAYLQQVSEGSLGEDASRNLVSFTLTAVGPSWRIMK